MQPEYRRKQGKAAGVAQARLALKAELFWLAGFPVLTQPGRVMWACGWAPQGSPWRRVPIDRERLRRSTLAYTRLANASPSAQRRILEEPEAWLARTPRLLEWLKQAVHHDRPLPTSPLEEPDAFVPAARDQSQELMRRWPNLREAVQAFAWRCYLAPEALRQATTWLEDWAEEATLVMEARPGVAGCELLLTLWELARQDEPRRLAPLLRLLGQSQQFPFATHEAAAHWEAYRGVLTEIVKGNVAPKRSCLPPPLKPRNFFLASSFAVWLARQRREVRRAALDLLALAAPDDLLPRWAEAWREREAALHAARRLVAVLQWTPPGVRHAEDHQAHAAALAEALAPEQIPPQFHFDELLNCIRETAAGGPLTTARQLAAYLERAPQEKDNVLVRGALLYDWRQVALHYPQAASSLLPELRRFLLNYGRLPGVLAAWCYGLATWNRTQLAYRESLPRVLAAMWPEARSWRRLLDGLGACISTQPAELEWEEIELALRVAVVTDSPLAARDRFRELKAAGLSQMGLSKAVLRAALMLDAGAGDFAKLVNVLYRADERREDLAEAIAVLAQRLDAAGWPQMIAETARDGRLAELRVLADQVTVLDRFGEAVAPPPAPAAPLPPAWALRYPPELHAPLATLATLTPAAENTATRLLDQDFPDPAGLEREIAALSARLQTMPSEPLQKRLASLLARRDAYPDAYPDASPVRLRNLREKLRRAVRRVVLERWRAEARERLERRLATELGVAELSVAGGAQLPSRLFTPEMLPVLAALLEQTPAFRNLGLRLLRRRCGPRPWRPLDDPANRAFVQRMERRGLNLAPWLNPPPPQRMTTENGTAVWLAWEDDPLEIFLMGARFHTCLSPGQINFFSVIANAADVNKQVLYVRDAAGRVLGRRLAALTDAGAVAAFHGYSHDENWKLDQLTDEAISNMACRLGTAVVREGVVSPLVAADWYDDGPCAVGGRFAFLQPGSPFRRALSRIALAELEPGLEAALAPAPLNGPMLSLVIELPEFENRPALIAPLLARLESCDELSEATRLRAMKLARRVVRAANSAGAAAAGAASVALPIPLQALEDFVQRAIPRAASYLLRVRRRDMDRGLDGELIEALLESNPSAALRVLRKTRPHGVRRDEAESDPHRRRLLALIHRRLGRATLAQALSAKR